MAGTVIGIHLGPDTHANRPAATAPPVGAFYYCTDHNLIYQTDGATWSTWADVSTSGLDFGEAGDIVTQAFGDVAAAGATGEVADAGHTHGMPTDPTAGDISPEDVDVEHQLITSGVISEALTAQADDWAPTNLADASVIRVTADADYDITGLTGGAAGRHLWILNVDDTDTLTLKHEDATSTAANRFDLPSAGDIALAPGTAAHLVYDGVDSRWRMAAGAGSGGGGASDHGALTGLSDDDHPQYVKDSEYSAKGVILVGTAAGTFVALGVGTDGHVVTADAAEASGVKWAAAAGGGSLEEGTAFPVGPTTGDRYRRTDLDYKVFFYDGTRWLSEEEFSVSVMPSYGISAATVNGLASPPSGPGLDLYLTRCDLMQLNIGTQDTTNHWDITIQKVSAANAETSVGVAKDTDGDAGTAWFDYGQDLTEVVDLSSHPAIRVKWVKTGSPGTVYAHPEFRGRYIAT